MSPQPSNSRAGVMAGQRRTCCARCKSGVTRCGVLPLLAVPKRNQVTMMMEAKVKPAGRRDPFSRAAKTSPLVLQRRDETIIDAVYNYGILSGEQIEQLIGFGCTTRRNAR